MIVILRTKVKNRPGRVSLTFFGFVATLAHVCLHPRGVQMCQPRSLVATPPLQGKTHRMTTVFDAGTVKVAYLGAKLLAQLKLHEGYSRHQIKVLQEKKLRKLIQHAYHNTLYYHRLFDKLGLSPDQIETLEDLKRLPPLTKSDVREHPSLTSGGFQRPKENAISVHTTGSTGSVLQVLLNDREYIESTTFVVYGFLKSGARFWDRFVEIVVPTYQRPHFAFERLGLLRQQVFDLRDGVETTLSRIAELKPTVLYSYPTFLALLARRLQERKSIVHRPRLVVTNGEVLEEHDRTLIQEAFECPVRNSYGAAEVFRIAYECAHNRLHVVPDSCIVEIDESTLGSDGLAEIFVTPLYIRTHPLIRYRLGDRVALSDETCPCGSNFSTIRSVAGRSDDYLTLPSGKKISPRAIYLADHLRDILEYQIVQKTPGRFDVYVRPNSSYGPESQRAIEQTIAAGCLPDLVKVNVQTVDEVKRTATGKLAKIISEVR